MHPCLRTQPDFSPVSKVGEMSVAGGARSLTMPLAICKKEKVADILTFIAAQTSDGRPARLILCLVKFRESG